MQIRKSLQTYGGGCCCCCDGVGGSNSISGSVVDNCHDGGVPKISIDLARALYRF